MCCDVKCLIVSVLLLGKGTCSCIIMYNFERGSATIFWLLDVTVNKFVCVIVQALTALLADDSKFGFIVMDGNCALFGSLSGNTREVLHKFTVDLPKKHGNY